MWDVLNGSLDYMTPTENWATSNSWMTVLHKPWFLSSRNSSDHVQQSSPISGVAGVSATTEFGLRPQNCQPSSLKMLIS